MRSIVAIIPARSGSRGLPHKNIRELHGHPLLSFPIRACKKSKHIERIIVSTDSEKYAEIARSYGAETPFLRPKHLAEDVPTEAVVEHAVDFLESLHDTPVIVVTLQCTTPFIFPGEIDSCVEMVNSSFYDSAMTVCPVKERPEWMFYANSEFKLKPVLPVELRGGWGVRQELPNVYRPNGACYATKRDLLMYGHRLIGDTCGAVMMPHERSIDVDDEWDWKMLEQAYYDVKLPY